MQVPSMLSYARRMRTFLVAQFRGWAFLPALAFVAIALTFLASGDILLGGVGIVLSVPLTWLGGIWILPWSEDAYALAMRDVIRTGPLEANALSHARWDRTKHIISSVSELDPPRELGVLYQKIVDKMNTIARIQAEDDRPLDECAVMMYETRQQLDRCLDELKERNSDGYAIGLAHAVEMFVAEVPWTQGLAGSPFHRRSERLAKIRPPQHWATRHDIAVELFSGYFEALHNFDVVMEKRDLDAVRRAAKKIALQHTALNQFAGEYLRDLGNCYAGRSYANESPLPPTTDAGAHSARRPTP
jgi:hypothetical protein